MPVVCSQNKYGKDKEHKGPPYRVISPYMTPSQGKKRKDFRDDLFPLPVSPDLSHLFHLYLGVEALFFHEKTIAADADKIALYPSWINSTAWTTAEGTLSHAPLPFGQYRKNYHHAQK